MTATARELVGWSEERWIALQAAVDHTLASTAKCRQVVPKGAELIGAKTVPITMVEGDSATPYILKDETTAPVYLSVPLEFDDQHASDEPGIQRLVESATALLGRREDTRILLAQEGAHRNAKLIPWGLAISKTFPGGQVGLGSKDPDATGVLKAIAEAMGRMDGNDRPGQCGLILANRLLTKLRQPVKAGDAPPLGQAEQLIGTNEIVGTSELDGDKKDSVCGVLFRIEPPAVDLVHTQLPTITVTERTGGMTKLNVEEEIALRVLDINAVVQIQVP
jgi:hypothetical protein